MHDPVELALRFALAPGLGVRSIARLRREFVTLQGALDAPGSAWEKRAKVAPELRRLVTGEGLASAVSRTLRRCDELGIGILALDTPEYPPRLAEVYDPPPALFVRGRLTSELEPLPSVAIVGTRKPSDHGLAFAYRLAGQLCQQGAVVVSGLAMGIDAEAHRAVVDQEGVGIGVLAGGLDRVHPPANRRLAEGLLERGCLVSEHPPGTSPRAAFFVGRNRLISALSRAVAIVEAPDGSGALLTAEFAIEQGRSVFAMPGRPGDPRTIGNLRLLREGATILVSPDDLAGELGLGLDARRSEPLPGLAIDGDLLLGGVSFDALVAASGLPAPRLLARLSRLEMDGRIRRGADGFYYRT